MWTRSSGLTGSATTAPHLARERARDEEEPWPGGKVRACGEKQGFPKEMEEWVGWGRAEIIGVKDDLGCGQTQSEAGREKLPENYSLFLPSL